MMKGKQFNITALLTLVLKAVKHCSVRVCKGGGAEEFSFL